MGGKIKQRVCIKFGEKLSKSITETLEMLHEAFGEHSSSWTVVLECHSLFKVVECQLKLMNIQGNQLPSKQYKMLRKFENSSTKTIVEQSMSSQTPLRSIMEFARRS
jgi:hypothetical protein